MKMKKLLNKILQEAKKRGFDGDLVKEELRKLESFLSCYYKDFVKINDVKYEEEKVFNKYLLKQLYIKVILLKEVKDEYLGKQELKEIEKLIKIIDWGNGSICSTVL